MALPLETFTKDPDAELLYGFDWRALGWLHEDDTISAAEWTITAENGEDPVELEEGNTDIEDGEKTLIRLVGGTAGVNYLARCEITCTPSGDKDARSIRIRCRNR